MDSKGPDAFRTISEVAGDLDLPQHVLRFWETRFTQIKPLKRGGGRRYYRPDDVELLRGIRHLLYDDGYTIKGVQRILKERGVRFVSDTPGDGDETGENGAPHAAPALPAAAEKPAGPSPERSSSNGASQVAGAAPAARPPSQAVHDPSTSRPQPPARPQAAVQSAEDPAASGMPPQARVPQADVPKDIILGDPPARKSDSRSLMEKIRGVPEPAQVPSGETGRLTRDDIRRLQSTLFELLECKRILDRSRSG